MKKLSLTALLAVIVSAMVGVPGYVAAAGCDPGSGCCGNGQTYVGQQLFPNPAVPAQTSVSPAANRPQPMRAGNVMNSTRKTQAAQTKATPIVPLPLQAARQSPEALTFSFIPCLGTLW
jgi:hypothetical protein